MKCIHIVAGGPIENLPTLNKKTNDEIWIAVDRGLEHLLHFQIEPNYVIGDFDSMSLATKNNIDQSLMIQFPKEKDETDLELALIYAMSKRPNEIVIYGATGGRLDHELANLQLLSICLRDKINSYIVDKRNRITLKKPGSYVLESSSYKYVSFLSLYEHVKGLTLKGFKYDLENVLLKNGSSLCISNELISKRGTYSFSSGILIVVESRD